MENVLLKNAKFFVIVGKRWWWVDRNFFDCDVYKMGLRKKCGFRENVPIEIDFEESKWCMIELNQLEKSLEQIFRY